MRLICVQIGIGHPYTIREKDIKHVVKLLEVLEERTQGCSCGSSCPECAEPEPTQPETHPTSLDIVDAAGIAHGYTEEDDKLHDEEKP